MIEAIRMNFPAKHSLSLRGRLRNLGFWSVLSILCVLGSGCSKDWDFYSYESDPLRELSLCIAYPDEESGFRLILDNGTILQPEKADMFDPETGQRYRVHYAIRSHNRDELFTAHIFELFPIDLIPCVKEETALGPRKKMDPVSVERLWSAGGFLNISFNCGCEGADNQFHQLQYDLEESPDGNVVLTFEHHCLKAGEKAHSHTLSTPLDSIFSDREPGYLTVCVHETTANNEVVNSYSVL